MPTLENLSKRAGPQLNAIQVVHNVLARFNGLRGWSPSARSNENENVDLQKCTFDHPMGKKKGWHTELVEKHTGQVVKRVI